MLEVDSDNEQQKQQTNQSNDIELESKHNESQNSADLADLEIELNKVNLTMKDYRDALKAYRE